MTEIEGLPRGNPAVAPKAQVALLSSKLHYFQIAPNVQNIYGSPMAQNIYGPCKCFNICWITPMLANPELIPQSYALSV